MQALVVVVVVLVVGAFPKALLLSRPQNKGLLSNSAFFILKKGNLFYCNPSVNHPLEHVAKGMIMIIRV